MNVMFFVYVLVGFIAQMIDGMLGMAYGVSCNTFLMALGLPPKLSSACVHSAEVMTTAASGLSHFKFGNVDKRLCFKLLIPGVIGGILGAYILVSLSGAKLKPYIAVYLIVMGLVIIWKAIRSKQKQELRSQEGKTMIIPLGFAGGFCDAIGGGGWGPIVTTTLVANGRTPRLAVGSVNAAEFLVTVAESVTFFITLGGLLTSHWPVILGLLLGGLPAAPLAAYACKKMAPRKLMFAVGLLIIFVSARTIFLALTK